jgi:AcrR family transcriptional regulator
VSGVREVKSRRRGEVLRDAILDAAWEELREKGWSGFRIERVAERAGTGKAAIYKRWANRAVLAQAAAHRMAEVSGTTWTATGQLRQELIDFLESAGRVLDGPFGEAARGIFAELGPSDDASEAVGELEGPPVGIVVTLVERAQRQGELGARTPPASVINLGTLLVTHHYLRAWKAPSRGLVEEIVDLIWLPALRAACADR